MSYLPLNLPLSMAVDDYVLPSSKCFQKSLTLEAILWQDTRNFLESFLKQETYLRQQHVFKMSPSACMLIRVSTTGVYN